MYQTDFRQFLDDFDLQHPAQVVGACARIADVRRKTEALAQIESNNARRCPYYGNDRRQKWGKARTNIQRYRCTGCKKTFTGRTDTRIERMHRPDLFFDVLKDMLGTRQPSSIRVLARRLGLNKNTIWRWRMIALTGLSGVFDTDFPRIVEIDETY